MFLFRQILKIPWATHVINEEVLQGMNTEREFQSFINQRKVVCFDHVMVMTGRKYSLSFDLAGTNREKRNVG